MPGSITKLSLETMLKTTGRCTITALSLSLPLFYQFDSSMYEDAPGTTVSRVLQVPQYVVLTAAEVMFSVTGLTFAYSQVSN